MPGGESLGGVGDGSAADGVGPLGMAAGLGDDIGRLGGGGEIEGDVGEGGEAAIFVAGDAGVVVAGIAGLFGADAIELLPGAGATAEIVEGDGADIERGVDVGGIGVGSRPERGDTESGCEASSCARLV